MAAQSWQNKRAVWPPSDERVLGYALAAILWNVELATW
jgi:hypothetical protein